MSHEKVKDLLLDYSLRDLDWRTAQEVKQHLQVCKECREELAFITKLNKVLKENLSGPHEKCPTDAVLVAFHYDELDPETSRHVKVHLSRCSKCVEKIISLEAQDKIIKEIYKNPLTIKDKKTIGSIWDLKEHQIFALNELSNPALLLRKIEELKDISAETKILTFLLDNKGKYLRRLAFPCKEAPYIDKHGTFRFALEVPQEIKCTRMFVLIWIGRDTVYALKKDTRGGKSQFHIERILLMIPKDEIIIPARMVNCVLYGVKEKDLKKFY